MGINSIIRSKFNILAYMATGIGIAGIISLLRNVITETYIYVIASAIIIGIFSAIAGIILGSNKPIAYNVAIIGYPKSGKTTLITALFKEILAQRIIGVKATLKGNQTIEKVNENIEKLSNSEVIGPTESQDRFAYSTNIQIKQFLSKKLYKVEFGDYPGVDSRTFMDINESIWLHKTEFFKWVTEADSYIFTIDLGAYLLEGNKYKNSITKSIRAAYQHILDVNVDRYKKIIRNPVVLAFTKVDLLIIRDMYQSNKFLDEKITNFSYNKFPTNIFEENLEELLKSENFELEFDELISFLNDNSQAFSIVHTSSIYNSFGTQELFNSVFMH